MWEGLRFSAKLSEITVRILTYRLPTVLWKKHKRTGGKKFLSARSFLFSYFIRKLITLHGGIVNFTPSEVISYAVNAYSFTFSGSSNVLYACISCVTMDALTCVGTSSANATSISSLSATDRLFKVMVITPSLSTDTDS